MPAPHPRMHGLVHGHGGPDPVRISWDDTGSGGGGTGGGPAATATWHDTNDDATNQDRWALNTFQIRGATLDTADPSSWQTVPSVTITDTLTAAASGELVYAFVVKEYVHTPLTPAAPFTVLIDQQQVPSYVSGGMNFVSSAAGRGPGTVNWSATVPSSDVGGYHFQSIMAGFKGTPSQLSQLTNTVSGNAYAAATLPATTAQAAGDILLVQVVLRNGNSSPALTAPAGWTLAARSPDRSTDTNWAALDQFIYSYLV